MPGKQIMTSLHNFKLRKLLWTRTSCISIGSFIVCTFIAGVNLHSGKNQSKPHIFKDDLRRLQSRFKKYQHVYTDGSKEYSKVGCAFISGIHSNRQHQFSLLKPKQLI